MLPGDRRKPTRSSVSLMLTTRGPVYWKGTGKKLILQEYKVRKTDFLAVGETYKVNLSSSLMQAIEREHLSVQRPQQARPQYPTAGTSAVSHCGNDVESEWGSPLIIIRYCVSLREPQFRSFIHSGALLCSVSTFRPVGKLD